MASGASPRQGDLFAQPLGGAGAPQDLPLQEHQLREWQQRLLDYQQPRFIAVAEGRSVAAGQINLLDGAVVGPAATVQRLDPLALAPQHLQF